uniref:Protein DBF4 homolog A n=1 Tax=Sphenodon punctatus TaxID=8508 RepID=A0A8D0H3K8_SPHPU
MKPSTAKISTKGQCIYDMQGKLERARPSLKTVKKDTVKPEKSKYKPLAGKVFYLDIPSNVVSEKLEKDLKELGGRVEGFLSKDISYLISSKKEAKFAQTLGQTSPVPSPESAQNGGNSSPHPSSRRDRQDGSSFKMVDTVRMSRGKCLVEKAIKEQELLPSGSILSNALSWGVKILHVDDIKNYIEQKKKELYLIKKPSASIKDVEKRSITQKSKTKLKTPFVKVEDKSCYYRPFYLQLFSFPVVNYSVLKPSSPFEVDKKNTSSQKQIQSKQRNRTNSDKDSGVPVQLPQKDKKKKGYCECCLKKYEDLQAHLESDQHRNFAQSAEYQVVDDVISEFAYDFVEYGDDTHNIKRSKCSVGQIALITGSITRTDELKERLKRQHVSLKSYSRKNITTQTPKHEHHHGGLSQNSLQKHTSEPSCSGLPCCTKCPLEATKKISGNIETCNIFKSSHLSETTLSTNLVQLPLQKDSKLCMEKLSEVYEQPDKEVFELNVNLNRKNSQEVQTKLPTLHTHAQVTVFSEKEKNTFQSKRKLNSAVLLPAKCLKKTDTNSASNKNLVDFAVENNPQKEHSVVQESDQPYSPPTEKEPIELTVISTSSSPSRKLSRKVKLSVGRSKRGNQKRKRKLGVQQTELPVAEEIKNVCSSPTQTLLELFQTSEANSDFGGFASFPEDKDSSCLKDTWEGQCTDALWSLFSSSSCHSPFNGF